VQSEAYKSVKKENFLAECIVGKRTFSGPEKVLKLKSLTRKEDIIKP